MEDPQFFDQIPQTEATVAGFTTKIPCFYRDMRIVAASFWAPLRALHTGASLGSTAPAAGRTVARDCHDHGVRDARLRHRGSQQREHRHPGEYPWSRHLAESCATGDGAAWCTASPCRNQPKSPWSPACGDIFGFPARLADLQWDDHDTWLACRVNAGDRHLLTLEGIRPSGRSAHRRPHMQPITSRQDRLVRCDLTIEILEGAVSMEPGTAKVAFGDHPLVDDLRTLELGRLAAYQYAPCCWAILGPPLESWPATTV